MYRYVTNPWDENQLKMTIDGGLKLYNAQQENRSLQKDLEARVEEQDRIIDLFKKYVPEHVIEETLSADEEETSLTAGESRVISVLFTGIQNFPAIAHKLPPDELVPYLNEYFSVIDSSLIENKIISPQFKDFKNGKLKIISFYAKKARGLMTRFLIDNDIKSSSDIENFNSSGYMFSKDETANPLEPVFVR